jgi:hypothetical protein
MRQNWLAGFRFPEKGCFVGGIFEKWGITGQQKELTVRYKWKNLGFRDGFFQIRGVYLEK